MEISDILNMILGTDNMILVSMGVLGVVSACIIAKELYSDQRKYRAEKQEPSKLEQMSHNYAQDNYKKQISEENK